MADLLLAERKGAATHITIDRADVGGLVSDAMATELAGLIAKAGAASKYVLFRSAGADFCLGRDRAGRPFSPPRDALEFRDASEVVFECYNAFRNAPIPIVGVVQGRALGFGCALAALCDVTIAADSARFAFPEMGHDIMPTMAMSSLIDRVGLKGLMYLTYSTEEVPAALALAYGIVSKVVPAAELEPAVAKFLAALDKAKPPALRAVKEYARAALDMDARTATGYARNLHATINTAAGMRG